MSFSAIYDANVLFPFEVRDILMVAARTSAFAVYNVIVTHNLKHFSLSSSRVNRIWCSG